MHQQRLRWRRSTPFDYTEIKPIKPVLIRPLSLSFASPRRYTTVVSRRQEGMGDLPPLWDPQDGPHLLRLELNCSVRREGLRTKEIWKSDHRARVNLRNGFSGTSQNIMFISVPSGANCATSRSATMGSETLLRVPRAPNARLSAARSI